MCSSRVAAAATGVAVTRRSAGALPAMSDPAVRRGYGIVVGLEFGLLGFGLATLLIGARAPGARARRDSLCLEWWP